MIDLRERSYTDLPHIFMRPIEGIRRSSADWILVLTPYMRRRMRNVMEETSKHAVKLGGHLTLRGSVAGDVVRRRANMPSPGSELWHISEYFRHLDRQRTPNDPDPITLYQFPMEINFKAPYEIIHPLGEYLTQRYGLRYISRDGLSEPAKWHSKHIYSAAIKGELSFSPPIPFIGFGFYARDPETRATDAICGLNIFPEGVPGAPYLDRRSPDASFSVDGGIRIPVVPGRGYPFGLGRQLIPKTARMEQKTIENLEGRLHSSDAQTRNDAAEAIVDAGTRAVRITESMRDVFTRRTLIRFDAHDPLHRDTRRLVEEAFIVGVKKDGDNAALRHRDVAVALMLHPGSTERLLEIWGLGSLFTGSELQDMRYTAKDYRRSRYQSYD